MQAVATRKRERFGDKYRGIILAVGFFLVLDLTALIMNFYVSSRIEGDAMLINISGRQRMLSQQVAKSLFIVRDELQTGSDPKPALAELKQATELFDGTLQAFSTGGSVIGPIGELVRVDALEREAERSLLSDSTRLWHPYLAAIAAALGPQATLTDIDKAVEYARTNSATLLGLMNKLTAELEGNAQRQAAMLRWIQIAVIVLALGNFFFILLNFVRSLRASDAVAETAREETERILATVNEGLFLLDKDGRIGSQMSSALPAIMGRTIERGAEFMPLLEKMVSPEVFASARDYIGLLFGKRVKEELVRELNPLQQIEVFTSGASRSPRYLTLAFNRVKRDNEVENLLVTVIDVTEQVRLTRELEEARRGARSEIASLLATLSADRDSLTRFLDETEQTLNNVNAILQQSAQNEKELRRQVTAVFRSIHGIKGDAAALSLGLFENLAHDFEDTLAELRDKTGIGGEDLLSLPPHLDLMLERVDTVKQLLAAVSDRSDDHAPTKKPDATQGLRQSIESLADRIAAEQKKKVRVRTDLDGISYLPDPLFRQVREIALQLLRNAIVHGIEPAPEREHANKPSAGEVFIGLRKASEGGYELVFRDDGHGIDQERIRDALRRSGACSEDEIARMDERQLYGKLFEPGFSTASTVDEHAGRGVGLDLVAERVRALGGRLKLVSRPKHFTEFSIRFAGSPSPEGA